MIVAGFSGLHDSSFCILDDGMPIIHVEHERISRIKESAGDSIKLCKETVGPLFDRIQYVGSNIPKRDIGQYEDSYSELSNITINNNSVQPAIIHIPHHLAHAAHAMFSSNFDEAMILSIDGGGVEDEATQFTSATCTFVGRGNRIESLEKIPIGNLNLGGTWGRVTRYVMELPAGYPQGSNQGTVMAMAAYGNSAKYHDDFMKAILNDSKYAGLKPAGTPKIFEKGKDPIHPYWDKWLQLARRGEQEKMDIAAALQSATEDVMFMLVEKLVEQTGKRIRNLCITGGVALNSVATGKILKVFSDQIDNIYIPVCCGDSGLSLGAAQYIYHSVLMRPRITWNDNFTPYLGELYSESMFCDAVEANKDKIIVEPCDDDKVIDLIDGQNVVAVFNGRSESGRRALGGRTILADPRNPEMKNKMNKIKARQHFRPVAPSVLREEVKNWFEIDAPSPYMNFVLDFKKTKAAIVPSACHCDGSARLQTVTQNDNPWYYGLISKWNQKTGVPILLNTSFNKSEPIVESCSDAINCFLRTEIDYLYFPEFGKILRKN